MLTVREVEGCNGCPLQRLNPHNTFVAPILGSGNRMVVGEAPGETESLTGLPFSGGAGKVLDSLLSKAGVGRSELTIVNTIQCRPPGNKYPTSPDGRQYCTIEEANSAVGQCYTNHILPLLRLRPWSRIDVLGAEALETITGEKGITQWRGQILEPRDLPGRAIVIPTIHPAALMRDQLLTPVVISDFKKSLNQPPEYYNVYPSLDDVRAFTATEFCFDIENNPVTGQVYMVGLSSKAYTAICVPFKGPYVQELKRIFAAAKSVIGHNIVSHDIPHLERAGVPLNPQAEIWDTLLMNHLIFPQFSGDASKDKDEKARGKTTTGGHSLAFVASIFTSKPRWKHQAKDNTELYCCRDTDVTMQIYPQQKTLLKQFDLIDTYKLVSLPAAKICYLMRTVGIKLDSSRIGEVRKRLLEETAVLESQLPDAMKPQQLACRKRVPAPPGTMGKGKRPLKYVLVDSSETVVPWRSGKLKDWLYTELKLPKQIHPKTKEVTVDKNALERLSRLTKDPLVSKQILAIRELRSIDETLTTFAKEKMTYGTSIHANFNVQGTNSGRLSSSDPNLQNIPDATRCIYVPHRADWSILQCDFSSIENRITATLAGDTERLSRFNDPNFSEHKWAVEQFFRIPMSEVKKSSDPDSPYSKAKHIVHGSNYGLGPRKMSLMYGIPEKEAKTLQTKWKAAIPKTSQWQEFTAKQAKDMGYLVNPFRRRRWFYTSSLYTESLSFIPQSAAADIILRCMIGLMYERIGWPLELARLVCPVSIPLPRPCNLLLQVHDALVVEAPDHMIDEVVGILKAVMEQPWREMGGFSNPIAVEVGKSWGELSKYNPKGAL